MIILTEANYTEFRERYKDDVSFALISGFQSNVSLEKNKKNNITLRKIILKEGYDLIKVVGSYQESGNYYEYMIVFCNNSEYKSFIRFLIFLAKKYYQNSIVAVDPDRNIWEYATRQDSSVGAMGSKIKYDKFKNSSINELNRIIALYTKRTYSLDYIKRITD